MALSVKFGVPERISFSKNYSHSSRFSVIFKHMSYAASLLLIRLLFSVLTATEQIYLEIIQRLVVCRIKHNSLWGSEQDPKESSLARVVCS